MNCFIEHNHKLGSILGIDVGGKLHGIDRNQITYLRYEPDAQDFYAILEEDVPASLEGISKDLSDALYLELTPSTVINDKHKIVDGMDEFAGKFFLPITKNYYHTRYLVQMSLFSVKVNFFAKDVKQNRVKAAYIKVRHMPSQRVLFCFLVLMIWITLQVLGMVYITEKERLQHGYGERSGGMMNEEM